MLTLLAFGMVFTIKWTMLTAIVLLMTGLVTTVIPIMGHLTPTITPQ